MKTRLLPSAIGTPAVPPALVMVVVTIVTTFASARPVAAEPPTDLDRAIALLELLDTTIVTFEVQDEPLRSALRGLAELSPVPVRADWDALDRLAVGPRDELTFALENAPLSTVLAGICLQLGDEFERPVIEVFAGQAILTTGEATSAMRLPDVYDVRDLLAEENAVRSQLGAPARATPRPATAPDGPDGPEEPGEPPADTPGAGSGGPAVGDPRIREIIAEPLPPRPTSLGAELMLLIAEHVDPDGWRVFGGSRATIGERQGVLLVTAPATTHRRLRAALASLRRAHVRTVSVQAALVDLPRTVFDRLSRRHPGASAAMGRALLAAAAGDEDVSLLWSATAAAALDQRLDIMSDGASTTIELALSASLDPTTGVLSMRIEADAARADDRRRVQTVVTLPFRDGGAVLELPAATAGERVLLLVVIPDRP